jgi:hypothetical protein
VGTKRCPLLKITPPVVCIGDGTEDTFFIRLVEMDLEDLEGEAKFYQTLSKYEWETFVETLYKRKDRKILPVNTPLKGGINPGG